MGRYDFLVETYRTGRVVRADDEVLRRRSHARLGVDEADCAFRAPSRPADGVPAALGAAALLNVRPDGRHRGSRCQRRARRLFRRRAIAGEIGEAGIGTAGLTSTASTGGHMKTLVVIVTLLVARTTHAQTADTLLVNGKIVTV